MTFRPTWAEIDLGAIRENCATLRALIGRERKHLAVVKANGYGHGDLAVSRTCLEAGVDWLAVALVEEGVRLRSAGIEAPVLVLFEPHPSAAKEVVAQGLVPTVYTRVGADALSDAAVSANTRHPAHVAVDTGMHREGVAAAEAVDFVRHVQKLPGLIVEGIWTHMASADEQGNPLTERQLEMFAEVCDAVDVPLRHLGPTAVAVGRDLDADMVRTGISVYGLRPGPGIDLGLRPAMRLVSHVSRVVRVGANEGVSYGHTFVARADTGIAVVPAGYADGYSRLLSNRGEVLIHGKRRRVAGRVTMDMFMADCGDDEISPGDEVVMIGKQGDDEITADEIAGHTGTINYEVACAVSSRVPRVYRG